MRQQRKNKKETDETLENIATAANTEMTGHKTKESYANFEVGSISTLPSLHDEEPQDTYGPIEVVSPDDDEYVMDEDEQKLEQAWNEGGDDLITPELKQNTADYNFSAGDGAKETGNKDAALDLILDGAPVVDP